jgi:putative transposase
MKYSVYLSTEQRSYLENIIGSGHDFARVFNRVHILLLSDRNLVQKREDAEIAESVMVSAGTVRRVRKEFVLGGLEAAIYDKPRPGAVPKITGDIEAKITMLACSNPPEGHVKWTLRLLAERSVELGYLDSISHVAIGNRLKKTISNRGR